MVWRECSRVLRDNGLLVFTYHHSRPEGWTCLLHARSMPVLRSSPFTRSSREMSVAAPKSQAKEPIDYDVIMVCRKRAAPSTLTPLGFEAVLDEATRDAQVQVLCLVSCGRPLSRNDARIRLMAQVLLHLSARAITVGDPVKKHERELEMAIDAVYAVRA